MHKVGQRLLAALFALVIVNCSVAYSADPVMELYQALERFYSYNYDVIISKYDIDKSYADYITAKLRQNPNFSFNYTGLQPGKEVLRSTDNSQISARIDQLIETGGKRRLRTQSASETLEAAKFTHGDAIRNLLIAFYTLFYNLNLDRLDLDSAKNELNRFDRILLIAGKRHDAGFMTDIDFTKLKVTRIDLETSFATLRGQMDGDLDQFGAILGMEESVCNLRFDLNEGYSDLVEGKLVSAAYQNRYDLLSMQKQSDAAKTGYALAKAMRIPDVTVGAEYDSYAPSYNNSVGIGFSMNLPIFERNQGNIYRKSIESKQIDVQIDKLKRQILSDVRQAIYNYRSSHEVFDSYHSKKQDMEYLIKNSEKALALGGITVLDLIDTEKTYFNYIKEYNKSLVKLNLNRDLVKLCTGEIR